MTDWFASLTTAEQVFWGIALVGTVIFLIVLATTFLFGNSDIHGSDVDIDAQFDSDFGVGFQFFTFKNLVGFFTIFGWAGISSLHNGFSLTVSIVIASLCGLIMMAAMAALFYYISRMTQSGTLNYQNALGAIGEVYLEIGKSRSKLGKVQVKVQGALREMEALTDHTENLRQGIIVQVDSVTRNGILIVKPAS